MAVAIRAYAQQEAETQVAAAGVWLAVVLNRLLNGAVPIRSLKTDGRPQPRPHDLTA